MYMHMEADANFALRLQTKSPTKAAAQSKINQSQTEKVNILCAPAALPQNAAQPSFSSIH